MKTLATFTTTVLAALVAAQGAAAQSAPPAGLGDQLFSTGGDIKIEVLRSTAGLTSELRLYTPDGSFTPIARNTELGRVVTLPARPRNDELVFGIFVQGPNNTFKMGPAERNPDKLAHAVVKATGERQYDVGFEDLINGGDRDYDDNTFRFSGGVAPNRSPKADDQSLTVAQDESVPITLTASDEDGDPLTYAIADNPLHGTLTGTSSAQTYKPNAGFSGLDTFGFTADDGASAPAEARVTITITPAAIVPARPPGTRPGIPPGRTTGSGLGDCPGELTLVNVRRIGKRVRVSGLAERTLAGAPVSIVEGGLVVARAVIASDGTFKVRVALPALRGGRVLRYQARLGVLKSGNLRLKRRMVTTSAALRGGRIVIRGRVVNARKAVRRRPVVMLLARDRGCGKTAYRRVGRARLRRDGRFEVSAAPLAGVDVAVYRASTRLRGLGRSYSLPQTIARP
jgi:hypothetical protein